MVNLAAFDRNPDQKEFHLFVECADKPHKRLYHGKSAAGGRMYVGVYRVPDEDDPSSDIQFAKDNDISLENKKSIAEYFVKWNYLDFGSKQLDPNLYTTERIQKAKNLFTGDDWDSASVHVQNVWIMLARLIERNYTMEVAPVEFVRFDEHLYQTLVQYDCMVERKGVKGQVSLDAVALHQYF